MRKTEGPLCRLCLSIVSNENIGEIGENIKEMLEVLQLKPNFHFIEEDIVCSDCMRSIQECLDLKLTYQNVEDFIVALYSKSKSKLDLREVYIQKNKYMTTTEIAADQKICRFCMKLNNISSCNSLITIEDMIQKCIPELDFNLTKEPVICDSCLNSLKIYFQFLQICVDTEEKIMKYLEFEAIGSEGPINLNKVVQFTKSISNNERDITKINVYPDMLCCEAHENNVIQSEVIDKKENAEFDTENFENDIKTNIEENVKIELKEESGLLHNGELEMIYEQNELHNIVKSEVVVERVSAKFDNENVENYIKTDVDENITNMEIKVEFFELQNEKLEIIDEENELQAEQIDFERSVNGNVFSQSEVMRLHRSEKCVISNLEEDPSKPYIKRKLTVINKNNVRLASKINVYNCDSCSYKTKRTDLLKYHLLKHRDPSEVKMYKCESCSYRAKTKKRLNMHELTHKAPSELQMYKCDSCSFQTKYKDSLKCHFLTHKDPSEITIYKCDSCSFETRFNRYLKKHSLIHKDSSEVITYKCLSCSFQTLYKDRFKRHELVHMDPSEVTMFKCNSCPFRTKYKGTIENHLLRHKDPSEITIRHELVPMDPSEVTMFKCDFCSYQTKRKNNFNQHLLRHKDPSEVTMYKCNSCPFRSKYKATIKNHLLRHKDPSEVTRYKCDSCSFQTKWKYQLNSHSRLTHKNF